MAEQAAADEGAALEHVSVTEAKEEQATRKKGKKGKAAASEGAVADVSLTAKKAARKTGKASDADSDDGEAPTEAAVLHSFTPEQLARTVFVGNVPPAVQHKLQKALAEHFAG